jgi:hypothetical protein
MLVPRSASMRNLAIPNPRVSPAGARWRTVMSWPPTRSRTVRWLVAGLLAALVVAGCSSDRPAPSGADLLEDPGLVHVHGLGINPAGSRSHTIPADPRPTWVLAVMTNDRSRANLQVVLDQLISRLCRNPAEYGYPYWVLAPVAS